MSRISFHPPTPTETHSGAAILCYMIDPQWGGIYFLLGKERPIVNWVAGSNKWSDFGGGRKEHDLTVEDTAAREFLEETLAVVKYFEDDTLPRKTYRDISLSLQRNCYTYKFYVRYPDTPNRYFVVFVKHIPWDPACVERFAATRHRLLTANAHYGSFEWKQHMWGHPAVEVQEGKIYTNYDFLEKICIGLWSLTQLQRAVDQHGKLRPGEKCRDSFLQFLPFLFLELEEGITQ